jgi:hypothetical protein
VNQATQVQYPTVQVTFIVIDFFFLLLSTLYPCSGMYRSYQFLVKVKATSTGKLVDSLPRKDAVVELCSKDLKAAYCYDLECKLPTPSPTPEFYNITFVVYLTYIIILVYTTYLMPMCR